MRTVRFAATLVAVLALAAGCGSSPAPTPSTPAPSAVPSASPATPSAVPSTPPDPTPGPSTAPTPVPTLSTGEAALLPFLRANARVNCQPRRIDLPPRITVGVECLPTDALVERVGIYGFGTAGSDPEPARDTYLERMAAAGVAPGSGDCAKGTPGDASWPATLPDVGDDGKLNPNRAGCFLDENGIANVRVTCYGPYYVGVLGRTKELAALVAWAWAVQPGESVDRDPPGICAAPD